jgi:hypothetical protein
MQKNYIEDYARHFNLKKSGDTFLNNHYEHVITVIGNEVHCRVSDTEWQTYKSGDLVVSIINNIPLHII